MKNIGEVSPFIYIYHAFIYFLKILIITYKTHELTFNTFHILRGWQIFTLFCHSADYPNWKLS